jgi:membrane protein DedA with SNARE-associated domain
VTQALIAHGLLLLFAVVALESAGVPLPGETALIAASILAAEGHYSIAWVIAVAAVAAVVGDNCGYWVGRQWGRRLLETWSPLRRWGERFLPTSERFFRRHGAKTIFLARFFSILRVTAAWLAGVARMPWWRFFLWNATGGVCWALLVGLVAFYGGRAAADAIDRYGLIAGVAMAALVLIAVVGVHMWKRRVVEET